jgi:hypothetical protein
MFYPMSFDVSMLFSWCCNCSMHFCDVTGHGTLMCCMKNDIENVHFFNSFLMLQTTFWYVVEIFFDVAFGISKCCNMFRIHVVCNISICCGGNFLVRLPLLENQAFVPGQIWHLYRVFLQPVQMWTFVLGGEGGPWHAPMWATFVPGCTTARYKCATRYTGLYHGPVQMCNGYNWLLLPPARATPLSTLSTRAPPSLWRPRGVFARFAMISPRFHSLKWCRG